MLERVKNELQNHQEKNQGLIKIVRDSLNEYESKLNSLRESLSEAEEQTKQGASLNADNKILLEDTKVMLPFLTPHPGLKGKFLIKFLDFWKYIGRNNNRTCAIGSFCFILSILKGYWKCHQNLRWRLWAPF